jgi:ATP-binding cassette, subfamily B, bacterial MsbA
MKTYLRLLSFARPLGPYMPQYLIFTLLAIVFGLINFTLLIPLFDVLFNQVDPSAKDIIKPQFALEAEYFKQLFNYYFNNIAITQGKKGALVFICVIIIISVFLSNLFRYVSAIILTRIRTNTIRNLRMSIFEKVTLMHLGYFSSQKKGDIMARVISDVQEVEGSVVNTLRVIFKEPVTIIAYFFILFSMSWNLTLFTLVLFPISGFIISEITKRLKKVAIASQESFGRLVSILDESLTGIRVIKAFNAREYINDKFGSEVDEHTRINISMAKKNELASPLSEFMGVTVVSGILLYGGSMVLNNQSQLSASEFITYIIIFSQVLTPAKAISNAFSSIQRGLASGERIFKIIDIHPTIKDKENAIEIKEFNDSIEFKNVSFAYEKKSVLKNINLKIKKGTTVALVGPSGGGKSTLADLVPRFYDPNNGELLIDGIPMTDCKADSIRRQMGIVTQESILFHDTIFNNIAFGMPHAKEEDVIQAAKIANAHDFIIQSPQGYQTLIGERGTKLSGGQRQRISIARAVLKNPPILILDEATSALDSESEKLVQEALINLMKNRTSIVIAHRLSTIQHANEIIVIENGEIKERGNHEELIYNEGLYKKLNLMQSL